MGLTFRALLLSILLGGLMSPGEYPALAKGAQFGKRILRGLRLGVLRKKDSAENTNQALRGKETDREIIEFNRKVSSIPAERFVFAPKIPMIPIQEIASTEEQFVNKNVAVLRKQFRANQIKLDDLNKSKLREALEEVWNQKVSRRLSPEEVTRLLEEQTDEAYRRLMFRDGSLEFTLIHPGLADSAEEFERKALLALLHSLGGHPGIAEVPRMINWAAKNQGPVDRMTRSTLKKLRFRLPGYGYDFASLWMKWGREEIKDAEIAERLVEILSDARHHAVALIATQER